MRAGVTLALLLSSTASGNAWPGHGHPPQRADNDDSVRVIRAARAAQADFELRRRSSLPYAAEGRTDRCDARIGRFCYWHDDAVQPRRVEESAAIVRARAGLLKTLDSLARHLPTNGWIAGQRVRYLVEAGRVDSAIAVAQACGGDRWWCQALAGLSFHEAARFAEAESAFASALSGMPWPERCAWTDLSFLLVGRAADAYDRASCESRRPINDRIWWLSQPFFSLGANDLRTEHYARMTMVRLSEGAALPQNVWWGDDVRELIVRYGWPRWFTLARAPGGGTGPPAVIGHDPEPSFAFVPDGSLLDSPMHASADDWRIRARDASATYAPPYAIAVRDAESQLARFLRGDSALIVAAYDASRDTLLARGDLRAALVLTPDERTRFCAVISPAPSAGTLSVLAPGLPALVSIELLAPAGRAAARTRYAIAPLDASARISLSDVLLYNPVERTPQNLTEVLGSARASSRVRADRPLGVYWEMYGLRAGGVAIRVSLTVVRSNASWWLRARRTLHLAGSDSPIILSWRDVATAMDGVAPRAMSIDLSRLAAGRYRLRIELAAEDGTPAVTEREFELDR